VYSVYKNENDFLTNFLQYQYGNIKLKEYLFKIYFLI